MTWGFYMTEHERLYQALDAITGGIADFLQARRAARVLGCGV